jgi:hypothetical protein
LEPPGSFQAIFTGFFINILSCCFNWLGNG